MTIYYPRVFRRPLSGLECVCHTLSSGAAATGGAEQERRNGPAIGKLNYIYYHYIIIRLKTSSTEYYLIILLRRFVKHLSGIVVIYSTVVKRVYNTYYIYVVQSSCMLRGTVDFRCTGCLGRIIFTLTRNYTLRYIILYRSCVCVLWLLDVVVTRSSVYRLFVLYDVCRGFFLSVCIRP